MRMVTLEKHFVEYVLDNCPARTEEAVMARFGISYNTLRKLEAGSPIRSSLATRLKERVRDEGLSV